MTTDMVKNPPHYQTESGLEAIDVIEAFFADNAHLANAFRYMSRLDKKWDGDEDLDKAIWYLQRLRKFRNGGTEKSVPNTHFACSEPVSLFRVGDRVRVIKGVTGAEPVGAIGKIQAGPDFDGDYEVKFADDWHFFEHDEIEAATEPRAGDILAVTGTDGHNFPHGVQVKVDAPGNWGGTNTDSYVLCSRPDGVRTECGMEQQSIRLDCTSW